MHINLSLHKEPYGNIPLTSAEPAPEKVQEASAAGSRMIGFILFIVMILLVLQTIILLRQKLKLDTMQNTLNVLSKKVGRLEKTLYHAESGTRGIESGRDVSRSEAATFSGHPPERARPETVPGKSESEKTVPFLPSPPSPLSPVREQPCFLCGLKVTQASHYNPEGTVILREIPREEAMFLLYSDMTVRPDPRIFHIFNNVSYYRTNDFFMIFDFLDQEGRILDLSRSMKCLRTAENALVHRNSNEYTLSRKGKLIAEERPL